MSYRIDHYYSLENGEEIEEGHIFCTPEEGAEIKVALETKLGTHGVLVTVEPGGEYDYSTEQFTAKTIAKDILFGTGFLTDDEKGHWS